LHYAGVTLPVNIGSISYSEGGFDEFPAGSVMSKVDYIAYPTGKIPRPPKGYHFQIQCVGAANWELVSQRLAQCRSMMEFNFRYNGGNSYFDVHLTDEKDITWLRLALA
jgi:hypothetical protein